MKTYRVGTQVSIGQWSPPSAGMWTVAELEWMPPHQRLMVRMVNDRGDELALTPHELQINGATHG